MLMYKLSNNRLSPSVSDISESNSFFFYGESMRRSMKHYSLRYYSQKVAELLSGALVQQLGAKSDFRASYLIKSGFFKNSQVHLSMSGEHLGINFITQQQDRFEALSYQTSGLKRRLESIAQSCSIEVTYEP